MVWLLLSSLILAFSIPINKRLFGDLNPFTTASIFCLASALFFFPFCKRKWKNPSDWLKILLIGAVQFGLMYVLFQSSFFFLNGHEVALLMVSTPAYVVGIDSVLSKRWSRSSIIFAAMAVLLTILSMDFSQKFHFQWQGIMLIQSCNFSFALGQILLKRFCRAQNISNTFSLNSVLYGGAAIICFPMAFFSRKYLSLPPYTAADISNASLFGIVCCGICHWFWNVGTLRTPTHVLATMNNLQIPLAVIVSCVAFGEKIDKFRFTGTMAILGIMILAPILAQKNYKISKSREVKF
ncbi:MAG: DMT family transporter [Puniceicoccales bacterium]|jgi:drug/metabolite transporter (DMT)-like permease|nr:DMT family transporter [Puniceicoccales bacterium]